MPPHSIGSGTISFGLVSIPIRLYTAASSAGVSFNLLHAKCGSRIKQQTFCPVCNEVVERNALVKGYEFQKDQYRSRVLDLASSKVEGKEITAAAPEAQRAQVIDLMDALKQSLAKRAGAAPAPPGAPTAKKPPMKAPRRAASPDRKAQAGRK